MPGVSSSTDNFIVGTVTSASKRILGTDTVNNKEPISSDLIHKIVSHANLDNPVLFICVMLPCTFFVSLA